eukprot:3134737-Amphidinium_carterae.1
MEAAIGCAVVDVDVELELEVDDVLEVGDEDEDDELVPEVCDEVEVDVLVAVLSVLAVEVLVELDVVEVKDIALDNEVLVDVVVIPKP